jgi:hypothetical protein
VAGVAAVVCSNEAIIQLQRPGIIGGDVLSMEHEKVHIEKPWTQPEISV